MLALMTLYFALHPMFSIMSISTTKDTLFASAHPTAENTFKLLLAKRTLASVLAEARAQA